MMGTSVVKLLKNIVAILDTLVINDGRIVV